MATTIKFSRQREAIKEYLFHTKEHPTADTIYMHIREQYPNISLGTVYRNLNFLLEQGEIIKVECGDGCDHFDGNREPHNHFICKECHKLLDLEMESIDQINAIANVGFNGDIEGHVTYFYGICEECKKNK
ncbi:Fur family peroxide stress response transcriptional regulator [Mobilisporobacter senegalensis]|uniref:Fur family peroxide stress response transcriptional regulator n=1 Tax=Mobilisporobacter senegalensis TaxID=1329262 RepID=A0A3N1Y3S7_9FIRM|nr:transcriptional repressor [Mobilisporobacter senegalensis]ROR31937.1 Fur family peroxide stress response transcriptional regulator [Mobilisporobacter senegalensis]